MRLILRTICTIVILLLPVPGFRQLGLDSSDGCQYASDSDPKQKAGKQEDDAYHFTYVSDYERTDQTYRRRICNRGQQRVWFDWELTRLTGWAAPGDKVENELSSENEPEVTDGPLRYDFRNMPTTGYKYPTKPSKVGRALRSFLSGFMTAGLKGEELVPAKITVISSVTETQYCYEVENDSSVPVQFRWNDFVVYWSAKENYGPQFEEMQKKGLLEKSSNWKDLILAPHAKIEWTFVNKGETPEQRIAQLRLFSRGSVPNYTPNYDKSDLAGLVSMYLPTERTPAVVRKK